ncbi:MAG: PIG-L family deacetylase [Bacteroidales bacterium]|nr:PIG-L family deacetylase [Candidatus Cacconaster caballi]
MNRRDMLKTAGSAAAGLALLGISGESLAMENEETPKRRKLIVAGAHPDDPETCAGGTAILYKQRGWDVVYLYLTRGERGISGLSHEEAAAVRVKEIEAASALTGIRYRFLSHVDGEAQFNLEACREIKDVIGEEKPDIVMTHWPIDSHRDHRVCSILVYDAWRQLDHSFELYYHEAMTGLQSQMFAPTDYVDITQVAQLKHKAIMCHATQEPEWMLDEYHIPMERLRGNEAHCKYAESFVHQRWGQMGDLEY